MVLIAFLHVLFRHVARFLCTPLAYLCNISIEQGIDPTSLEIARVVTVFKAGVSEHVNNYRLVSILPYISKVLEK